MRTLTLGFLNCADVTPHDLVDVAAQAGFDSVGLRITGRKVGDPYTRVIGHPDAIADIVARLARHAMRLSNLSAYHLYPDVTLRELVPLLDTAQALGTDTLLASCYDGDRARFCRMLASYADAAAERGLRLALEFVPFSRARSLADALDIVGTVDRENVGLVIDPLHLARSGGSPEDLRRVPAEWFFFGQLCDAARERPEDTDLVTEARLLRREPGAGALPLREILDALPAELELECEFPTAQNMKLPPVARATGIRASALRYLAAYDATPTHEESA